MRCWDEPDDDAGCEYRPDSERLEGLESAMAEVKGVLEGEIRPKLNQVLEAVQQLCEVINAQVRPAPSGAGSPTR